jgi:surface antigen
LRVVQQSKKSAPGFVIGGRTRKTYGAVCDDKNGGSF